MSSSTTVSMRRNVSTGYPECISGASCPNRQWRTSAGHCTYGWCARHAEALRNHHLPPKRGIVRLKDGGTKDVRQMMFSWARAQPIADARTDTLADAPADARTNADTAAVAPADVRADADAAADASSADLRAGAEAVADARTMYTTMNEPGARCRRPFRSCRARRRTTRRHPRRRARRHRRRSRRVRSS